MAEIMSVAEDHRDRVTIILAGYKDDLEQKVAKKSKQNCTFYIHSSLIFPFFHLLFFQLFAFNPGMSSRFQNIHFEDFDVKQLADIWDTSMCKKQGWKSEEKVTNIAAARVARGIGKKGFGNARTVRKLFERTVSEAIKR